MSTLAERQLAAWQDIARTWPTGLLIGGDDDGRVIRCSHCSKGIALAIDEHGAQYRYTQEQWLALVVLHLRNHHPDLDPDHG